MHTTDSLKLALIYGSTREGRLCDTLVEWAAAQIGPASGYSLDRIDPRDFDLPAHFPGGAHAGIERLSARLAQADAFVVVTPEYNHSFPAILKQVIDVTGSVWKAKPVAFISYGGVSGGLRAVEQLRLVYAELHAVTVRNVVSVINAGEVFDSRGHWQSVEQQAHAAKRLARQLEVLRWWAQSLKAGRSRDNYALVS